VDYTDTEIWQAFVKDEADRYAGMLARPRRALDGMELTAWEERPATPGRDAGDVIADFKVSLASWHGLDPGDLDTAILALTGGERDDESTAAAILALGEMRPGEVQGLVLSLAAGDVSAAERRELAKRGMALEDGSYPIKDRAHLHSAAVLAASGHGDVAAARKLIRKMAAHFGVDLHSLPGFSQDDEDLNEDRERARRKRPRRGQDRTPGHSDDDYGGHGGDLGPSGGDGAAMSGKHLLVRDMHGSPHTIALTEEQAGEILGLAGSDGEGGPLERITREHPEYFPKHDVFIASSGSRVRGRPATRAQAGGDHDDPSVDHQAKIDQYLRMLGDTGFVAGKISRQPGGMRSTERPYGAVQTYGPRR